MKPLTKATPEKSGDTQPTELSLERYSTAQLEELRDKKHYTLLVPVHALEQLFHRGYSARTWVRRCRNIGIPAMNAFYLNEMREKNLINWWEPQGLVIGTVRRVRNLPNAKDLISIALTYDRGRQATVLTSTFSLAHFRYETGSLPVLRVPYAAVGSKVQDVHSTKRPIPLKTMKVERFDGHLSEGMLCSEREVGISEYHNDIFLLPQEAPEGMSLGEYLGDGAVSFIFDPEYFNPLYDDKFLSIAYVIEWITSHEAYCAQQDDQFRTSRERPAILVGSP